MPWLWAVGIVVLLSLPQRLVPEPETAWGWPWPDVWNEAAVHAFLFAGQVFWCSRRPAPRWGRIAAGCLLFAILTEVYQGLLGYRSAEFRDVAADLAGIVLAVAVLAAPWRGRGDASLPPG
ncbi:MAG: VanZ family protein [Acidobacteria bacterium]|nr:VanZ family protein [Acidobacteriota bacterium]